MLGFLQKLNPFSAGGMPRAGATAHQAADLSHPDLRRWLPRRGSADSDLLPEMGTMVSRARDLTRNHGVANGALQTITDNVVGVGLRLSATPDYRLLGKDKEWAEEWSNQTESLFRSWADSMDCDAGRSLTFDGLTTQVFRSGWLNGEGLALPLWMPERGTAFATRLHVIEPDRLCNPIGEMDTATRRGGIEIDRYGAPLAYWVRKTHPGDAYLQPGANVNLLTDWERIPAVTAWGRRRVIHAHDKERSGQTRGKTSLASVMRQFKVLGDFQNAELKAAVVNAMVAIVSESQLDQEGLLEMFGGDTEKAQQYLNERGNYAVGFADPMVMNIPLGDKLSGFVPTRPSTAFEPFVSAVFSHIATGLNIPYELLMKDFRKTNYSSARAALNEAWKFFKGRRAWLSTYWARPVYELWLEEAVNAGIIEAPGFYENRAAYTRCRWIGAGRGWIDPVKEATAAQLRMDSGLSTLEKECAEQGDDWEEVLEQRARERTRMKELGLLDAADASSKRPINFAPEEKDTEPAAPGTPEEEPAK